MAFMKIFNTFVRFVGWSPINKTVFLRIDDAADVTLNNNQLAGRLVSLNKDGTAIIDLHLPILLKAGAVNRLLAVPRHNHYNFYSLCFTAIAVNLLDPLKVLEDSPDGQDAWFAIATLSR